MGMIQLQDTTKDERLKSTVKQYKCASDMVLYRRRSRSIAYLDIYREQFEMAVNGNSSCRY